MTPLLISVLVVFSAQQMLMPVLAPLARELMLTESQLGIVITVAAAMLTITSPLWGRLLDRVGRRTVILAGLGLATAGLAGFAAVAALGLDGAGSSTMTFILMIITRGVLFGIGITALPVAALTAATTTTTNQADRTRAVSLVGAAQGLSLVLGPAAGGALAVLSLLVPVYLAPVLTGLLTIWMLVTRKGIPKDTRKTDAPLATIRPWDARIWPLLSIGFMLYLSLGMVQVVIGFFITDRLHLDPSAAAGSVGVVLFAAGLVLVAAQAVVVPRLRWSALRLLRVGIPIGGLAFILLYFASHLWSITACFAVLALGLGLAMPGFSTAPTLVVDPEHHGAIAGLVTATMGATFIVAPIAGTALYETNIAAPIIAAFIVTALAWTLVWLSPAARRLGNTTTAANPQRITEQH